jgi:uncharacterized membrane protein YtjA (UPF0391 family)
MGCLLCSIGLVLAIVGCAGFLAGWGGDAAIIFIVGIAIVVVSWIATPDGDDGEYGRF